MLCSVLVCAVYSWETVLYIALTNTKVSEMESVVKAIVATPATVSPGQIEFGCGRLAIDAGNRVSDTVQSI